MSAPGAAAGKILAEPESLNTGVPSAPSRQLLSTVRPLRPLSAQSDARLVELIRAGSERAFDALARRYRRELLIYADRLLGGEGRAEDVVQQALLQAWIALDEGAEVTEVRAWLYRIVHNSAVTLLRRARHDTVELNEALDAAAPDQGQESRLLVMEIFAGLAVMPEPQRRAILMTAVGGNSHGEAAAALGLTDGAVRGLVYRARSALRRAAAAVLPVGLWHWGAGQAGRRALLAGDATDAAGAAGSAGVAAAVIKGSAILATAGALAGAGQAVLPTIVGPSHHPRTAQRHAAPSSAQLGGAVGTTTAARTASNVGPLSETTSQPGVLRHDTRGSGGSGRGGESREEHHRNGSGTSGEGSRSGETHDSNGSGPGPSRNGGSGSGGSGSGESSSGSSGTSGSSSRGTSGSSGGGSGRDGGSGGGTSGGGSRASGSGDDGTSGSSGSGSASSASSGASSGSSGSSSDGGGTSGSSGSGAPSADGGSSSGASPSPGSGSSVSSGSGSSSGSGDATTNGGGITSESDGGGSSGSSGQSGSGDGRS
jgi:RNA polymerase sigma factor (sigma-70 family)